MKELVIISGKGGTGKTSITASFAALAQESVLADCDVDAADLHLILKPAIQERHDFSGGKLAEVRADRCVACGACAAHCRFDALRFDGPSNPAIPKTYRVDRIACEGCAFCAAVCPNHAIEMVDAINGEWYLSETRFGPMAHARLGIAEENSGKLVTLVRNQAKRLAVQKGLETILIDGSPGIGCPVIASITGADLVLVVTEATQSGLHDLRRVAELTQRFNIKTLVAINKHDLNEAVSQQITQTAHALGLEVAGRVRYDNIMTQAQIAEQAVVEYSDEGIAEDLCALWETVVHHLDAVEEKPRQIPLCQEAAALRDPAAICPLSQNENPSQKQQGANMKIAIPTANGQLCAHFGHCQQFALVEVDPDEKKILSTVMETPPPHEPGVLPRWLHEQGANLIIAGGMGQRAQMLFQQNDIQVVVGAGVMTPEDLVTSYLNGALQTGANLCDH